MITRESIRRLAIQQQTTEQNVARECAQHLFLAGFYQQRGAQKVMFKGGAALRIVYQSPRFSEDLDFSGFGVSVKQIEDCVAEATGRMEQAGVMTSIRESKRTSGGYLGILEPTIADFQVRTLVEVSLRRKEAPRPRGVLIASELLPAYTLVPVPESDLVDEKLQALLTRKKPRDFFDCYFMLRKGMIPPAKRKLLRQVKEALLGTRVNFKAELGSFLPRSHQAILSDFKQTLLSELERFVKAPS
jgi:predicted nucleotidyltransferase component of viral defense system